MNTQSPSEPKPVSEAKLEANQANAKLSSGPSPEGRLRSRFNAVKNGLTAARDWPGLDTPGNRKFFRQAFARLGPRNGLEAIYVSSLLRTRLQERLFLEVEADVLTRKPVGVAPDAERAYPFLNDPVALKTLEQFARHLAHLTHAAEKEFLALLQIRKDSWSEGEEGPSITPQVEDLSGGSEFQHQPDAGAPAVVPGTLEDCLADTRLILPGEDAQEYQTMARELWAVFRPTNILEGFVTQDFIQAKWRLERVLRIEGLLLERSAVSATGANCGVGFAFVHDSQRNHALESLRPYEAGLRKRMEKRMALLRKLRKEGWQDSVLPHSAQPAARPQPHSTPTHLAPNCGTSKPTLVAAPTAVSGISSSDYAAPPVVKEASAAAACQAQDADQGTTVATDDGNAQPGQAQSGKCTFQHPVVSAVVAPGVCSPPSAAAQALRVVDEAAAKALAPDAETAVLRESTPATEAVPQLTVSPPTVLTGAEQMTSPMPVDLREGRLAGADSSAKRDANTSHQQRVEPPEPEKLPGPLKSFKSPLGRKIREKLRLALMESQHDDSPHSAT